MMHLLNTVLAMLLVFNQGDCIRDRIIGGHEAKPHSRPYMVLVVYRSPERWSECDGFLVREDFVMTAAHCKGTPMYVYPGLISSSKLDNSLRVKAIPCPHPKYTSGRKHDIMLLKLKNNVTLTNKVGLLALPRADNDALPTTNCLVPGWGATVFSENSKNSDMLREINVTIDTSLDCGTPAEICTRATVEDGPFKGDSGGPLVCGEVACGVVSQCSKNDKTFTHYYIRIAHYHHWIDKIMNTSH
ncbi:duodenase-1 [Sardina pilchardus]|uniref:duodenase-1 n=1 Tax=Sardina pilchardus TaxID=27697 RepID=UPI002E12ECC7